MSMARSEADLVKRAETAESRCLAYRHALQAITRREWPNGQLTHFAGTALAYPDAHAQAILARLDKLEALRARVLVGSAHALSTEEVVRTWKDAVALAKAAGEP